MLAERIETCKRIIEYDCEVGEVLPFMKLNEEERESESTSVACSDCRAETRCARRRPLISQIDGDVVD